MSWVPKREIKMGKIEENWQPAKFYCSEIFKLIYSIWSSDEAGQYLYRDLFPGASLHCSTTQFDVTCSMHFLYRTTW